MGHATEETECMAAHTHTPDRLLYKTVGFDARISQKLHMQPSPNIPRMLPLAPAQPALAALR